MFLLLQSNLLGKQFHARSDPYLLEKTENYRGLDKHLQDEITTFICIRVYMDL